MCVCEWMHRLVTLNVDICDLETLEHPEDLRLATLVSDDRFGVEYLHYVVLNYFYLYRTVLFFTVQAPVTLCWEVLHKRGVSSEGSTLQNICSPNPSQLLGSSSLHLLNIPSSRHQAMSLELQWLSWTGYPLLSQRWKVRPLSPTPSGVTWSCLSWLRSDTPCSSRQNQDLPLHCCWARLLMLQLNRFVSCFSHLSPAVELPVTAQVQDGFNLPPPEEQAHFWFYKISLPVLTCSFSFPSACKFGRGRAAGTKPRLKQ